MRENKFIIGRVSDRIMLIASRFCMQNECKNRHGIIYNDHAAR